MNWRMLRCFFGVHWFRKLNIWGDKVCVVCGVVR